MFWITEMSLEKIKKVLRAMGMLYNPKDVLDQRKEIKMQTKLEQWEIFSKKVSEHIETYVVPQYGDYPDEHIGSMTLEQIKGKLSSYVARMGKVQVNGGFERAIRDMLKMAHFACYAIEKMPEDPR